jgi:hypothetical protein
MVIGDVTATVATAPDHFMIAVSGQGALDCVSRKLDPYLGDRAATARRASLQNFMCVHIVSASPSGHPGAHFATDPVYHGARHVVTLSLEGLSD